jgi:hypothetical protein
VRLPQVSCERYDAKAVFKKWDRGWISLTSSFIAYGSTEEKAVSRATAFLSTKSYDDIVSIDPNFAKAVMPIAGCVCTAVARDGKPHAMALSFPATSGLPEQSFAFATPVARDSFVRALQEKCIALANAAGGKALAEVSPPHPAAAYQAPDAAARNPVIDPTARSKP